MVTIEISEDDADLLATLVGHVYGDGPGEDAYSALIAAGATDLNYYLRGRDNNRLSTIFPERPTR